MPATTSSSMMPTEQKKRDQIARDLVDHESARVFLAPVAHRPVSEQDPDAEHDDERHPQIDLRGRTRIEP